MGENEPPSSLKFYDSEAETEAGAEAPLALVEAATMMINGSSGRGRQTSGCANDNGNDDDRKNKHTDAEDTSTIAAAAANVEEKDDDFLMEVVRLRATRGGPGESCPGSSSTREPKKMMMMMRPGDIEKSTQNMPVMNAYLHNDDGVRVDQQERATSAASSMLHSKKDGKKRHAILDKPDHSSRSSWNSSLPGAFAESPSQRELPLRGSPRQYDGSDDLSWPTLPRSLSQTITNTNTNTTTAQAPVFNNNHATTGSHTTNTATVEPSSTATMTDLEAEEGVTGASTTTANSGLLAAELVEYEQADILQQDVILLSPQEKENMANCKKRLVVAIAALIALVGTAASIAFVAIGMTKAIEEQDSKFQMEAKESIQNIQDAFEEYVNAVAMVHMRCRKRDFSRQDFRDLYEYLVEEGLQFKAVQFLPNTTHQERPAREADSHLFYSRHYPYINYTGFRGFNHLDGSGGLQPRQEEPWYFPIHYMEPVRGNEAAIDLDYHSSEVRIRAVDAVFQNAKPSLSDRLNLVKKQGQVSRCGDHNGPSYGVVLAHPGINLTRTGGQTSYTLSTWDVHDHDHMEEMERPAYNASNPDAGFVDNVWPRDLAAMVVCIPDLLSKSMAHHHDHDFQNKAIYIHDQNRLSLDPVFMGGAHFQAPNINLPTTTAAAAASSGDEDAIKQEATAAALGADPTFLEEVPLSNLKSPSKFQQLKFQGTVMVANRIWTVTVLAIEGTYKPQYMFVLVGGVIIFVGTLLVASWVYRMSNSTSSDKEVQPDTEGGVKEQQSRRIPQTHQ